MRKISCIVIDDEPLAIKLIETFIERTPFLALAGSYTNPIEAFSAIKEKDVDLIFLDIQMPDMNGMELSRMVPEKTRIIFTTAFKDYAFDSYEVNAIDFLLKPIHYSKFIAAVEKAQKWFELSSQKNTSAERNTIFIKVDGLMKQIDLRKIDYVCGMKDYVSIYLEGEKRPLITHITMKIVEEMLPKDLFMRVHRSYIVALDKIKSVDRNHCIYIREEVIHVTDQYADAFDAYLEANSLNCIQ
jgi:two-component system LytT family response regulator